VLTIRPCETDEIGDVLALWAASRSAAASTPDTPDGLERVRAQDAHNVLVAEFDERIVGALIAASDGWRGNMYRLAVDPSYRRQGIARRLVAAGEGHLRERGVTRVTALVEAADSVAAGLWDATGYRRDAAITRFVRNL
jgi:ribosomal protein S18 acetylase RimI-like enzyme